MAFSYCILFCQYIECSPMMAPWHETLSALLALCEENPPLTGGFPTHGSVMRRLNYFFCISSCKPSSIQSNGRRFKWRRCKLAHFYTARTSCDMHQKDIGVLRRQHFSNIMFKSILLIAQQIFLYLFKFQWSAFLRVQHNFFSIICLCTEISLNFVPGGSLNGANGSFSGLDPNWQVIYHLNQWWPSSLTHICVTRDLSLWTHWGRVTHICVSKLTTIGSDNGLSPGRTKSLSEPVLEP